uniref:Uncharacterized protein n=1 Tax=Triticum urartu TaxID=4572 RepID=A0A8R7UER0_TRIUA
MFRSKVQTNTGQVHTMEQGFLICFMSRNTFHPRSGVGCGYIYKGINRRPHYRISFVILVEGIQFIGKHS